MNQKIFSLQKTVKERVKESQLLAKENRGNKFRYKIIGTFVIMFGIFNVSVSLGTYLRNKSITLDFWFYLVIGIASFEQLLIWRSMLVPAPPRKLDFEEWVWKGNREQVVYWGIFYLIISIANLISPRMFGKYQFLAVFSYLAYVIFVVCIIAIVFQPKLFMSGFVGGIGKIAFWTFFVFMPLRVVLEVTSVFQTSDMTILILSSLLLILFLPFFFKFRNKNLNEVQSYSAKILKPNKLFLALRPYEKELKDKYQALKLKLGLDKELSYGVKAELVKLYAQEHKSRTENIWFVTALFALVFFLLESLSQSFIEDKIYYPIIKPILERIF